MASPSTLVSKLIKSMDPNGKQGALLLWLNTFGMIFAALSNTFGVMKDKNTSQEDKKFLVPAGALTGVANIGVYYAITQRIIDKLQGKEGFTGVADKQLAKMEKEGTLTANALEFVNKKVLKAEKGSIFGIGKKSKEYVESMKVTLLDGNQLKEEGMQLFKDNVKAGYGVLGAFAGAVIGCAVLTPIIRDVSAYFVQKRMERHQPDLADKPYRPYFNPTHIMPQYKDMNIQKQPLSMKNYMNFTNGKMKV